MAFYTTDVLRLNNITGWGDSASLPQAKKVRVLIRLFLFLVHCVSGGNFRPPNGSVVAHQVGDVNITFECDIYDDNGNQTFTQWSIKNLRGVPGLKSVPLTFNNTLIEGDVGICPILTTCRNRLIFPELILMGLLWCVVLQ